MRLNDLVFEYIYQNAGISKEKINQTERDVLGSLSEKRKEWEASPESQPAYLQKYFNLEKNPFVMMGLLFCYSLMMHFEKWRMRKAMEVEEDD